MPYRLEQSGSGYYVVGPSGRHSRKPLPRRRAAAQMRALYAAETKDAGTDAGATLHGPGGLLGTPGMGGRRWGNRRKDARCTCNVVTKGEQIAPGITRIRGNLCNVHGRYGPCDGGASSRKPRPRTGRKPAKPKLTPEQRAQERQAQRDANRSKVLTALGIDAAGQAALTALREGKQPDAAALAAMGAIDAGLVEQAADGSYRLTASGRAMLSAADQGDQGRAGDTISGARDRLGARRTRQEAAAQRKRDAEAKRAAAAAAKKLPKASSGSGKKQSTPGADRAAERQRREEERQADRKRREDERQEDRARRQRERDEDRARAQREGMNADLDRRERQRAAPSSTSVERTPTHTTRIDRPKRKPGPRKRQTTKGYDVPGTGTNRIRGWTAAHQAIARWEESIQRWVAPQPSFAVFKSADGTYRWLARSTTAYRDRDGEIITIKALDDDAQRMTASGQYGPLRYWHVGQPDPFDVNAPWGPGLDIGDCDYSIVIGRTAIESGTFKSAAIGQAFADSAGDYELSPGFFHPPDQPNAAGEYAAIRRFERSVVPIKYGRASNLFTGLTVKEHRMDEATYKARVDAYLKDMREKGVPPEVAAGQLASMEQADKSAQQQGIAYKSDDQSNLQADASGALVYTSPDGTQGLIVDGRFVALKAATEKAAEPPVEMLEAADTEAMDAEAELVDDAALDAGGEYIGDMTPQEFWAQLQQYLAPVLKMQEMHKALSDMVGELKGMGAAYATKDAGTAQRLSQIEATLAALKGDQPAVVENEALAALKSTGPQAPPDPDALQVPDDPERPWAGLNAAINPQLYRGVQGYNGANGWQIGQLQPPPINTGGN